MISNAALSMGLAAVGLAARATAQTPMAVCDIFTSPNWSVCDRIVAGLEAPLAEEPFTNDCDRACMIWTIGSENCQVGACFLRDTCYSVMTHSTLSVASMIVQENCGSDGGYTEQFNMMRITFENNPDHGWGGSRVAELADDGLANVTTYDNGVQAASMSFEEYEALQAELYAINHGEAKTTPSVPERRHIDHRDLAKRQNSFRIWAMGTTTNENLRQEVSDIINGEHDTSWSFSETKTIGLDFSTEMSAGFFDIFSASVGISVSEEHSETIENGMTVTVNSCPSNRGYVVWDPIMDFYDGYFTDEPDQWYVVWVPTARNGYARGEFRSICLS